MYNNIQPEVREVPPWKQIQVQDGWPDDDDDDDEITCFIKVLALRVRLLEMIFKIMDSGVFDLSPPPNQRFNWPSY